MASDEPEQKEILTLTAVGIETAVAQLAGQIRKAANDGEIQGIVPVAFGGLIPGAMLAYVLGVYDVWPVFAKSYQGQEQKGLSYYIPPRLKECEGEGYMILDDICDTGVTLRHFMAELPKAKSAALVTKTDDPHFWALRGEERFWYSFPWERSRFLSREGK
jgi:xanthine phosphoribosyltransferase